eukprot:1152434-Pelagomonas_calceolata.AAC.2
MLALTLTVTRLKLLLALCQVKRERKGKNYVGVEIPHIKLGNVATSVLRLYDHPTTRFFLGKFAGVADGNSMHKQVLTSFVWIQGAMGRKSINEHMLPLQCMQHIGNAISARKCPLRPLASGVHFDGSLRMW